MKSYTELMSLRTFKERFDYLHIGGKVGEATFGGNRWMNQMLYHGGRWRRLRNSLIIRDDGCDLGLQDHRILGDADINGKHYKYDGAIFLHHINPVTDDDIMNSRPCVFDPENLICTSESTHRAIHFGRYEDLIDAFVERRPFDTCPWKEDTYDSR